MIIEILNMEIKIKKFQGRRLNPEITVNLLVGLFCVITGL